ncbi:MAG: Arabinose efflux permease [Chthonomonadales bacterium]|nr:Arabinose efflux permease [Chthonomonadales bacterium]
MKRSPLIILFITLFIDLLGFGMILPLLPIYISHYGGGPRVAGALMATFSTMQFLFSPIWGRASDRYGRRPLILLSLIGSAISYFFFGMANSLAVLFAARVASGILTAASIPTAQAYIADVTTPEKRAGGMAMIGAAFGLGFAFGPMIGGVLGQYSVFGLTKLATPALFAASLALVNFVLAYFLLPESLPNRNRAGAPEPGQRRGPLDGMRSIGTTLRNPSISPPMIVFAFTTFAFTAVETVFSWLIILRFRAALLQNVHHTWQLAHGAAVMPAALEKTALEAAQTGATTVVFGIVGITVLVTQLMMMGGLARKFGENRLVMFGTLMLTVCLLGIAFAPSLPLLWVASCFLAVGNGVLNPSLSALIMQGVRPNERGTVSGAQQSLGSLARIIAPPINTSLVAMNTAIPFVSSAVLMSIGFLLALRLRPLQPSLSPVELKSGSAHPDPE